MLIALVGAVGIVAAELARGDGPRRTVVVPRGNATLADAERFVSFPLYFPGAEFDGLPLTAVDRQVGPPLGDEPSGMDQVMFAYGTCTVRTASDGGSCAPPLTVLVWDACDWRDDLHVFRPDEGLRIRGAEAAFFEGFRRLEIYANKATIVMFGAGREPLLRAAGGLRGVNNALRADMNLPANQSRAERRSHC
jgi:hypothetical protein